MRSFLGVFIALCTLSCNSKKSVLTEKEFAKIYMDSLIKKYPTVSFELNPDLTITSKKGDLDFKNYTDNAYIEYKGEPDSIREVIGRYLTASTDIYIDKVEVNKDSIVPVIKPIEYLTEINSLNSDKSKAVPLLTEKYNDNLVIAYAEDSKNSLRYLLDDDLKKLGISKDSLASLALNNFKNILPNIQIRGDNGLYMVTAGGNYEASLILLTSIWTKETFQVAGDFIIAIPNRDMLLVTGSQDKKGIAKIKEIASDSYKTGNYQVSEYLYKWTGKIFKKYE